MDEIINILRKSTQFVTEARKILGNQFAKNLEDHFDIGILTSTSDEFSAIGNLIEAFHEFETSFNDSIIYYRGIIRVPHKIFKVVVPYPVSMGIEASVCTTTKLINHFNPSFLVMTGVCAGNKMITKIGDIIIADKSLNYNNVVDIEKDGKTPKKKFMQNADSINKNLKGRLSLFAKSTHIQTIKSDYENKGKFPHELNCHIGLMVTGSSLVRSAAKINEINESYHGVKGMDMETAGFYFSSSNSLKSASPSFVSIKSVSDFGDDTDHKISADERKKYALYTSSMAVIKFITNELK